MREPGRTAVLLLALLVLGGPMAAAAGGGSVSNTSPTVPTFTHSGAATQAIGSVDLFTATVLDNNGEDDLVAVRLSTTSGPAASLEHILTAADIATTIEPAGFTDGWKVWNPTPDDGALSVRVQVTLADAGAQTWAFNVRDEGDYQAGPAAGILITVTSPILVAADPVGLDGGAQTGVRWGAWSAEPGAVDVQSTNYLRVTNTGGVADQSFILDFSDDLFRGLTNATKTIPLDGNVQFAWWEDTTPAATSPAEGTFAYGATSADGSVAAAFSGAGNVIYLRYRLAALPDPLLDQNYEAALTVTPL